VTTERPTSSTISPRPAAVRPLPLPARVAVLSAFVAGAIVAAPSGFGLFWFIPYAGVGVLLVIRRPRTSIGWILLALGYLFAVVTLSVDATAQQFADGSLGPVTAAVAVVSAAAGAALFFLFARLSMVFPSGRLPGGRWGVAARLGLGVGLFFVIAGAVGPTISVSLWANASGVGVQNPAAILPELPIWSVITPDTVILPVALLMIAAAVSLVVRYRRAEGIERQQLQWITAALAFVVVAVVSGYIVGGVVPEAGQSGIVWLGAIVAFPGVPIAIGIAVLRYRLYDIDRIISRTIGYLVVTGILAVVFVAAILVFTAILSPVLGENPIGVAASTLVVAALFQPLRGRVQRVVDRRFDRSRYDGRLAAAAFGDRLRDEVDLRALRAELLGTVDASLRPVHAGIWLRRGQEDRT
jgi:hypothetical protein